MAAGLSRLSRRSAPRGHSLAHSPPPPPPPVPAPPPAPAGCWERRAGEPRARPRRSGRSGEEPAAPRGKAAAGARTAAAGACSHRVDAKGVMEGEVGAQELPGGRCSLQVDGTGSSWSPKISYSLQLEYGSINQSLGATRWILNPAIQPQEAPDGPYTQQLNPKRHQMDPKPSSLTPRATRWTLPPAIEPQEASDGVCTLQSDPTAINGTPRATSCTLYPSTGPYTH